MTNILYFYKNTCIMSLCKEQIEHLERYLGGKSYSRKWRKNQFNRFMRRKYKKNNIDSEEKPKEGYSGWEW